MCYATKAMHKVLTCKKAPQRNPTQGGKPLCDASYSDVGAFTLVKSIDVYTNNLWNKYFLFS